MRQLHATDPQLGADLEEEIKALTKRRSFGLVFERHQPEAVELPGIKPRRGSKVHVLPPRGSTKKADPRLWQVISIAPTNTSGMAKLVELYAEEPEETQAPLEDLVVVAEFKDGIYPGLIETGRVERGGDKPFHTVINAENYHALEMLTYTHRGRVDAIYIDPPYNTGAKDWKYNNNYVEGDDAYRHSKWLAMMERRLLIAKELLNPEDSVLIVTIDEKEYLRLGILLEQTFPEAIIQMVSSVIAPQGSQRPGQFSRVEEYLYFITLGDAQITYSMSNMLDTTGGKTSKPSKFDSLLRRGTGATRSDRPGMFYPVFVDPKSRKITSVGEALPLDTDRSSVEDKPNAVTCWPIRTDGSEGRWQVGPQKLRDLVEKGYAEAGSHKKANGTYAIRYMKAGAITRFEAGETKNINVSPRTIWNSNSHNASVYGSTLIRKFIPTRTFPFPKSLYAVEDALRFFVKDKPEAVVLDFFSGSGTTAHAVMRLNNQDGGRRQCIMVTNNEVGADEQNKLRKKGLRPGDPEWEQWGICDYITKPRVTAAITGRTPEGDPIKGNYKFNDEFPMSDGFEENAAFFTLTYESPLAVRHHRAFERVAPMLWMRAGSQGRIITSLRQKGWDISEVYGVLGDFNRSADFFNALEQSKTVRTVFFVTDDDAAFQMACRKLPDNVKPVRLYSSYLENFEINRGRA